MANERCSIVESGGNCSSSIKMQNIGTKGPLVADLRRNPQPSLTEICYTESLWNPFTKKLRQTDDKILTPAFQ